MSKKLRRTLRDVALTGAILASSLIATYTVAHTHGEVTRSQAWVSVDLPHDRQLLAYASHGPTGSSVGIGQTSLYTYHGLNTGVGVDPGPFLPCLGFEVRGNPGPFIDREC